MAGREARLGQARGAGGLIPEERGWFVVNAAAARWKDTGPFGLYCPFEGKLPFLQLGINIKRKSVVSGAGTSSTVRPASPT